jgi:hypothetical protein
MFGSSTRRLPWSLFLRARSVIQEVRCQVAACHRSAGGVGPMLPPSICSCGPQALLCGLFNSMWMQTSGKRFSRCYGQWQVMWGQPHLVSGEGRSMSLSARALAALPTTPQCEALALLSAFASLSAQPLGRGVVLKRPALELFGRSRLDRLQPIHGEMRSQ